MFSKLIQYQIIIFLKLCLLKTSKANFTILHIINYTTGVLHFLHHYLEFPKKNKPWSLEINSRFELINICKYPMKYFTQMKQSIFSRLRCHQSRNTFNERYAYKY